MNSWAYTPCSDSISHYGWLYIYIYIYIYIYPHSISNISLIDPSMYSLPYISRIYSNRIPLICYLFDPIEVSYDRGTPSHHPFLFRSFPYQPASSWGTPMTMETPISWLPHPGHGSFFSAGAQERGHLAGFHVEPGDDRQRAWQISTPGGFQSHGATPVAGWLIRESPKPKWMMTRGTPVPPFMETHTSRFPGDEAPAAAIAAEQLSKRYFRCYKQGM